MAYPGECAMCAWEHVCGSRWVECAVCLSERVGQSWKPSVSFRTFLWLLYPLMRVGHWCLQLSLQTICFSLNSFSFCFLSFQHDAFRCSLFASLSPSWAPTVCMLVRFRGALLLPQALLAFLQSFFVLFSALILSIELFQSEDSSVCSNLPLNPSSEVFISVIILFGSRISFWFILHFLSLHQHFHFAHALVSWFFHIFLKFFEHL